MFKNKRLCLCSVIVALAIGSSGCAGLVGKLGKDKNKGRGGQNEEFKVTLEQVEKAQREAEADPILSSVTTYVHAVAGYAFQEPAWDAKAHVARLDKLVEQIGSKAQDEHSQGRIEDLRAMVRIAARDVPGAREIYRRRFETKFNARAFKDYLQVLKQLSGVLAVEAECKEWYGKAKDDEARYELATQCIGVFRTRDNDGTAWLPDEDRGKIKEEQVIRSAEIQATAGKMNREKARQEGRYISAHFRGLVDVKVRSQCDRTVTLVASAGPRTQLGPKLPIGAKSAHTVLKIQADHLLWLLDEGGHRVSVARMDMWDGGLLVTAKCNDIIPMK